MKPGFARNYLLPRRLAIPAGTKAGEPVPGAAAPARGRRRTSWSPPRAPRPRSSTGVEVNIPAQANEEDTLFGSVTNADVAEALAPGRPRRWTSTRSSSTEHIKQLGRYDVSVKFYGGVTATVKVWVVRA